MDVTADIASGTDNSVARCRPGTRVAAQGVTDGPGRFRLANRLGNLGVGCNAAARDAAGGGIDKRGKI